jgi:fumarate reductase (CoM/CoB) subunit A
MVRFSEVRHIETDVLIIGAGVAGMMAVVGAKRSGVTPLIVTKGTYASGSSSMARGGHSVAVGHSDAADNPELFFEDIQNGGDRIGNPRLIDVLSVESIARSAELDAWGLGLVKLDDGRFDQKPGGFPHRYPRMVHCGKLMGKPLMAALSSRTLSWGIEPLPHVMFVDLMRSGNRVIGAWGFLYREGIPVVVHARSTVVATGGAPQLHTLNDSPPTITGDGYAMAYRAAAELIDMEFIDYQIITAAPPKLAGYPPYSTGLLAGGGFLRNASGERFMARHDANKMERSTRAMINRAMALEVFEGRGTPDGNLFIDIRHVYDEIIKNGAAADVINTFAKSGVDLRKDFLEVTSAPHTYLGGLRIDEWGRTSLEGLYSGGEAAGGVHGANRLGGLALIDSYVFGLRSGIAAALEAGNRERPDPASGNWQQGIAGLAERLDAKGEVSYQDWRRDVQRVVQKSIGQVRTEESLDKGLAEMGVLEAAFEKVIVAGEQARQRFESLRQTYETRNLIHTAQMLGTAALERRESRGGHFRFDFPKTDDQRYLGNFVVWQEDGKCQTELRPVPRRDCVAPPPPGEHSTEFSVDLPVAAGQVVDLPRNAVGE